MKEQQNLNCPECGSQIIAHEPPFPPQIQNGHMFSTVAMMNGNAECPNCHAKFITQIAGVQLKIGFMKLEEQSRIVVPTMVPPKLNM